VLASVLLLRAGLVFTALGAVAVVKFLVNRGLRKDASDLPTDPLSRGWYRADGLFLPPAMAIGVVGLVLLIVAGVKYLI